MVFLFFKNYESRNHFNYLYNSYNLKEDTLFENMKSMLDVFIKFDFYFLGGFNNYNKMIGLLTAYTGFNTKSSINYFKL